MKFVTPPTDLAGAAELGRRAVSDRRGREPLRPLAALYARGLGNTLDQIARTRRAPADQESVDQRAARLATLASLRHQRHAYRRLLAGAVGASAPVSIMLWLAYARWRAAPVAEPLSPSRLDAHEAHARAALLFLSAALFCCQGHAEAADRLREKAEDAALLGGYHAQRAARIAELELALCSPREVSPCA